MSAIQVFAGPALSLLADDSLPGMFAGPKNDFMDVLRAIGSLMVVWFIFKQMLTSFTVARMVSAGLVAGFCVWLINGGIKTVFMMVAGQLAPLGSVDTWFPTF